MIGKIRANLFPGAWPAVEPWRKFPWDRGPYGIRTWLPQSSQAIAIDIWGCIRASPERDDILNTLADALQIPRKGRWTVRFEWIDPYNELREKRRTQVDVVLKNDASLFFVECKFTEREGGSCSRPIPKGEFGGLAQCNGNYETQADPIRYSLFDYFGIAPIDEKCSLTREGIGYWNVIDQSMNYRHREVYIPCPFAGPRYQWMRNIVMSKLVADRNKLIPCFILAYAEHPLLPFSKALRLGGLASEIREMLSGTVGFHSITYQEIIRIVRESRKPGSHEARKWAKLQLWIDQKIARVIERIAARK